MEFGSLTTGLVTGLREGVEAALIVGIILAYLEQTGNRAHFAKTWMGTAAAAAVSVLLGLILFVTVREFEEPYEQVFEATTMFVAAGVLTWMLFWMRRTSRNVRGHLHASLDKVLSEGGAWGLALLAFTAVIREGIETSLFLVGQVNAAATTEAGGEIAVLIGAVIGLAVAVVIGWMVYVGARRINYGTFFRWTGLALIFIAAGLISRAIHELVEISVVNVGTQPAFNLGGVLPEDSGLGLFLRALLGYSSSPEVITVVAYLLYLVPVLWLYLRPVPVAKSVERRPATIG